MANPEHLKILKQGVEQWNRWRIKHGGVRADLSGADLAMGYFWEADLHDANLAGADFRAANLCNANLSGADLTVANFGRVIVGVARDGNVDPVAASLTGANLTRAHLNGARLDGTDLRGTNLSRADLAGADFTAAVMQRTVFNDVALSSVKGLETIIHDGPSTIGVDTIYASRGKIPEVFLRGCGLTDWEIEAAKLYDPSLSSSETTDIASRLVSLRNSQPFQYYSCFISYSTRDQEFAERLHADLQAKGVRCWFAPHDMHYGKKIHEQIDEAIRLHDKLLLILSEHRMSSEWVGEEIARARKREAQEKRQMLFPVGLAPFDPVIKEWECFDADRGKDSAREIREYPIPDFSRWKEHDSYQAALGKLVSDLKAVGSG